VDTRNPNFLDPIFGTYFDGTPVVNSQSMSAIGVIFPSGATVVFYGNFTLGFGSPITGVGMNFPGGALLMSLTGLTGLTIGDLANLNADQLTDVMLGQVTEVYTQGFDDVLVGDASNEIAHAGGGNDVIKADGGNDVIHGDGGNDVLDGEAGFDQMFGGTGNDTFYVESVGDVVTEFPDQGLDLVRSTISYTLPPHVENLILDPPATNGVGNVLNNAIQGNDNPNTLDGSDGNDKLEGRGGNDTLIGGAGNDTLDGGSGVDSMSGGDGDDLYVVDDPADSVEETPWGGSDTVRSAVSWVLDAAEEHLVLIGSAANATGNAGANVLTGNDVNNVLDGGRGADSMSGGKGDDTYYADFSADQVTELSGAGTGIDSLVSRVPQVLAANVENLTLVGSTGNLEGIGNGGANILIGNDGANLLDGGAGNDQLQGHAADDTLLGGAGNDTLAGGSGRDVLGGGVGNDHFVFDTAISSGTNIDQITDFVSAVDAIDLSAAIFTALGAPGSVVAAADLASGAGAVAGDASDRVIHDTATGMLYYDADGTGAQPMIPFAQVNPGQALAAADLHVIA
jgi:Ca2+-binding RTX toxin-like protein